MRKNINIKNEASALKFEAAMKRFGYTYAIHFIEDMITFFENNPVNPKQNFSGLLINIENKMDEFHKDNNRVIAVLRNIEKVKIDPIYRGLLTDMTTDLRAIKKKILLDNSVFPNAKNNELLIDKSIEKPVNVIDNNVEKLTESYEKKLKSERERYKFLQQEYDKITLEHASFFNRLKKLSSLYVVEKSTFGKNKIVFEYNEDDFLDLIKLK